MTTPIDSAALAKHYASFLEAPPGAPRRLLLTGHSHQAWPDVARAGQDESFVDAALHVDDKWSRVFAVQDELRQFIAARLGGRARDVAFASSTHELTTRFLSALDLAARPHVVTTTGEFHSLHRQLARLAESGVEVTFVPALPAETLAERMGAAVRADTAAVMVSSVLFETSTRVPHLADLVARARAVSAEILVDAYHAWGVVPFHLDELGGAGVFVVAGGYKYAQWGEGVCFLTVPEGCALRPIYTGWYAGFAELEAPRDGSSLVSYERDGADRFAGSTFDPASFYRARRVAGFFDEHALTPERLRARSLAQTERLLAGAERIPSLAIATPREPERRGGFVSLRTPAAKHLVESLRALGVYTDARGDRLRLGPAPYLTDDDLDAALELLARAAR